MSEITLSDDVTERIEHRIQHTDFESVDEYAEFVLSEVLARTEHGESESDKPVKSRDDVQNRLKSLGYLEE